MSENKEFWIDLFTSKEAIICRNTPRGKEIAIIVPNYGRMESLYETEKLAEQIVKSLNERGIIEAEREKVRKLVEAVNKILKAKRSYTCYLPNPQDNSDHYPSLYVSYEVESWLQELEKEIEEK